MSARTWRVAAIAAVVLASWLAFARLVAPGLIEAGMDGRGPAAFIRLVRAFGGGPPAGSVLARWREFADAVALATGCWLVVLQFVLRFRRPWGGDRPEVPGERVPGWSRAALAAVTAAFLGFTVQAGVVQDYYHYGTMWREIWLGHDPWFLVRGVFGHYPLNAYGPLFNPLALPAWVHPLFPKLIFASSFAIFASRLALLSGSDGGHPAARLALIMVWLWNPFVWVEVAYYGHFDVLVGLLIVAALESLSRGRDRRSGTWLGLGVLLKYMPLVLLPFLSLDGRRVRWRFLIAALIVIGGGLGVSALYWGRSTFRPLEFAATRDSHHLSIYRYLRGSKSPLVGSTWSGDIQAFAPVFLFLGLLRTWSWYREKGVTTEAASVLALFVTVLLYRVGFAQYQMVPFMLVSWWLVRHGRDIDRRTPLLISLGAYFAWLSVFDLYESRFGVDAANMQDWVGLPTFILGWCVVACLVRSAPRRGFPPADIATGGV
ncbi:MAG: glycosyltransferase family 87 protein [Isosphaeraceae bacterium]